MGSHTPHGFVLPQSTQQWGKRPLHIKVRSFLINTFPCASLSDVGFHGMQDPLFGSLQSTPLTSTCVLACGAHTSGQSMALISSVTTLPHLCRYCPLWGLIPLTVLFSPKVDNIYTVGMGSLQFMCSTNYHFKHLRRGEAETPSLLVSQSLSCETIREYTSTYLGKICQKSRKF